MALRVRTRLLGMLEQCQEQWVMVPDLCRQETLILEGARSVAAELGGELLSESYEDSRAKLRWRCATGQAMNGVHVLAA